MLNFLFPSRKSKPNYRSVRFAFGIYPAARMSEHLVMFTDYLTAYHICHIIPVFKRGEERIAVSLRLSIGNPA